MPKARRKAVLKTSLDVGKSGAKALPEPFWFQTMHRLAAGTAKTAEKNAFRKDGKIGEREPVPPEGLMAAGTAGRFHPGEILAQTRNFVDVGINKQYQLSNSLPGV